MIHVSMHFPQADKYRNPFVLVDEQSRIAGELRTAVLPKLCELCVGIKSYFML